MSTENLSQKSLTTAFGLIIALAITALCYWPSLSGPFVFDDFPNLSPLGAYGGIHSWDAFWHFITSGNAGPLGRPVSLASFAANAQDWPASPYPFRLTNLGIHLLNGLLVFWLARCLFLTRHTAQRASQYALLAAAFWLLHPLLVSTTAFIVQRMTQLACSFSLLALIGYLHGRGILSAQPRRGWAWILASMGIGGCLGLFSKESAVLLPLFALSIEASVFANDKSSYRRWLLALFALPTLALAAYLGWRLAGIESSYAFREFNLQQRLMTEARIVVDYLLRLLFPRMQGAGLYHDDFPLSTGLLSPVSTLISFIGLTALMAIGWAVRRKQAFLSLGILWFLAGHLLESTIIPLELYYEHRNYLPAVGIAIAAASLCLPSNEVFKKLGPAIALLFIALEAFITWQNAVMWSSQYNLVHISVKEHPTSLRALERASLYYSAQGDHRSALAFLEVAASHHPKRNALKLSVIQTKCLLNELESQEVLETAQAIATSRLERESILYLPELSQMADAATCQGLTHSGLLALVDGLESQRKKGGIASHGHTLHYHRALLLAKLGQHKEALSALTKANSLNANIDSVLLQVVWLISVRDYVQAQEYLDKARKLNARRPQWQPSRQADIDGFQGMISKGPNNPDFAPLAYPFRKPEAK